jgi:hypothetical protein
MGGSDARSRTSVIMRTGIGFVMWKYTGLPTTSTADGDVSRFEGLLGN